MKISGALFTLASLYLFTTVLCSLTESEESSKALKSNKNQNDESSATNAAEVSEHSSPPKSQVTGTKKRKKGRGMGKPRKKEENDNGLTTTEEPEDEDDLMTTTMKSTIIVKAVETKVAKNVTHGTPHHSPNPELDFYRPEEEFNNVEDGDLSGFSTCSDHDCSFMCRETRLAKCDKNSKQICLCPGWKFVPIELEANTSLPNLKLDDEAACAQSCISRSSYGRILKLNDKKDCVCLTYQVSKSGITLCDSGAEVDVCKKICKSESANCAFNGVCLCRKGWSSLFNMTEQFVRTEIPTDHQECSKRCRMYHHDFVGRIYDPYMNTSKGDGFGSKYCLCGPELMILEYKQTKELQSQGFQICSGLKCKQRCGMREAYCEPKYRRACICQRQNIFIGPHLWSRLPSHGEKFCQDACFANGLHARVIERNPLLIPASERFQSFYRYSMFSYGYDGKFCHCIKIELDMNQFRPCSDELCRWLCGHADAICDVESRRACICKTHNLIAGLGRKGDSGEVNCDQSCRHWLMNGRIIDVTWDTTHLDGWGVTKSKFCGCVRSTTPAGLTHCEGGIKDNCPNFCNNPEAYCTRERYCECGINMKQKLLGNNNNGNGAARLPTGTEKEECGEKCRSWMWPIAEDEDNFALIYDTGREECSKTKSCPPVDTTPWDPNTIGFHVTKNTMDEIQELKEQPKKYCLCTKSTTIHYKPGTRILPQLRPHKAAHGLECIGNHSCKAVGNTIHITD